MIAFFAALVVGALFARDDKAYGEAIVYGLCKPMFAVIVLAVMLAAVSGKLISASGMVQTIANYVVAVGLTGRWFVAAAFFDYLPAGIFHRHIGGDLFCGHPDSVPGGGHGRGGTAVYAWRYCIGGCFWGQSGPYL